MVYLGEILFHLRQRNGGIIEALRYLEREGESGKISKNAAGIRVQPSRGRIVELKSINYPKVSDSFQAMKLGPGHHGRAFEIQASAAAMLPFFLYLTLLLYNRSFTTLYPVSSANSFPNLIVIPSATR